MLRLHFTAEDIARVRIAAHPDHLWEIANSVQILTTDHDSLVYGEWRRHLVRPPRPIGLPLATLLPPRGYSPDFLTPDQGGSASPESAVDAVLRTPRSILLRDLTRLAAAPCRRRRPPPAGIRALAVGDPEALRRLGVALRAHHRRTIAPYWSHLRAQLDADRAVRARAVLAGGVDGLFASFRPLLRWRPPILEVDYPVERDLRLGGRGLLLQPSFFCTRRPVMLAEPHPELTPVLVHPIQHTLGWARDPANPVERGAGLGALIGHTRAAILEDVATARSTGQLAERFGISGAAVSQHTAVLRRSGLLTSLRRGRYVLHALTPAGRALLDGALETPLDS